MAITDLSAVPRTEAFRGLGADVSGVKTAHEVGEVLGLNGWDVHSEPAEHNGAVFVRPTFHTVATINGVKTVLGTSGERRSQGNVSNETLLEMVEELRTVATDATGTPTWETAGTFDGNTKVFATIALNKDHVIDPSGVAERITRYVIGYNSHDGSLTFGGGRTGIRPICRNTFNMAIGTMSAEWKFRHTGSIHDRIAQLRSVWAESLAYFRALDALADTLFVTPFTDKQYDNLVVTRIGKPPEKDVKGSVTKYERNHELYTQAWKMPANAGIKGTAYGALMALTEREQWGRGEQSDAAGAERKYAAGAGFNALANKERQGALDLVLARAGVKVGDVLAKVPAL